MIKEELHPAAERYTGVLRAPTAEDLAFQDQPLMTKCFKLLTLAGDNWYLQGDFKAAVPEYEQALAVRPHSRVALHNLALALHRSGEGNDQVIARACGLLEAALLKPEEGPISDQKIHESLSAITRTSKSPA